MRVKLCFTILIAMRSRYRIHDSEGIYFVTATVVEWLPAFTTCADFQVLLDSLAYCRREKQLRIYAYVLMENHLHMVVEGPQLSRTLQAFKSFTAQEIVKLAEAQGRTWLLNQFAYYRKRFKEQSRYQVWQEGLHPQVCETKEMFNQKIAYIHDNPVRRGWVDVPEHWRYSSARNILLDDHSVLEIDPLPE